MEHISTLFKNFEIKKSKISNKRQTLIKEFVENLNIEREGTKYKPLTSRVVAIKLGHLSEFDLEAFLSMAKDYKNRKGSFSKYYWGTLKNKNGTKNK